MRFFNGPCPVEACDGSGYLAITDFTGTEIEICPCSFGTGSPEEPPAEVAERLALVIDADVRARRRTQELLNNYLNRDGDRHDELCEDC